MAATSPPQSASSGKKGSGWEVNVGALAFSGDGVSLKPQCLFGANLGPLSVEAGLHDVRNGLKLSAQAEAAVAAEATGMSLQELHETIEINTIGFREALEIAKEFLNSGADRLSDIASSIGISTDKLKAALAGKCTKTQCTPMTLKVTAETGVGLSAEVRLGWKDTQGYNMVGVGGKASAAISLRLSAFAGRHSKKRCAKILLGITNFKFEYVFPIGSLEGRCPECEGSGTVKGTGFMGVGKTTCPNCSGIGQIACDPQEGAVDEQEASAAEGGQQRSAGGGAARLPASDVLAEGLDPSRTPQPLDLLA